eukprot:Gb_08796 [translate_table: standard]
MQGEKAANAIYAEAIKRILGQNSKRKKQEDNLCKQRDEMTLEKGCDPNTVTYNKLIGSLCKAGKVEKAPTQANELLSNPQKYIASTVSAGDAQTWELMEHVLTFTIPENATTNTGAPFWSPPTRFPKLLEFMSDSRKLGEVTNRVHIQVFHMTLPNEEVKIVSNEKATTMNIREVDDSVVLDNLIRTVEEGVKSLSPNFCINPIQFEKDDNTIYHMDVIVGLVNNYARNYRILEVDKLKAKFVTRRIIPAITTAIALVCLELYKLFYFGSSKCLLQRLLEQRM